LHEEAPGWSDSDKSWRGAELWGPGSGVIKDIESVAATAAAAVDAAGAELTAALADFGPESDEVLTAIEDLLAAEAAAE
jgi:hypothetical protein